MKKYTADDFRSLAAKFKASNIGRGSERDLYVADYAYGDLARQDAIADQLVDMLMQAAEVENNFSCLVNAVKSEISILKKDGKDYKFLEDLLKIAGEIPMADGEG